MANQPVPVPDLSTLIAPLTAQQMLAQLLAIMQKTAWAPLTDYAPGSYATANGNLYVAVQAATGTSGSGAGPSGIGYAIADGTVLWAYICASNSYPAFPTTSWQPESFGQTNLQLDANAFAFWETVVSKIAASGFLGSSNDPGFQQTTGPAAGTSPVTDLIAQQVFNERRSQATTTVGYLTLTDTGGVGPVTVGAGQYTVTDANGHLYTNTNPFDGTIAGVTGSMSAGTIPKNGSLVILFSAQSPGAAYNIGPGTTLTLVTSKPGITATNPAILSPPFPVTNISGSWIVQSGNNIETDTSLITRCWNKWGTLGTGSPVGAWQNWCFDASDEVRTAIVTPTGFGTAIATVYGNNSGVSPTGLGDINTYLTGRVPMGIVLAPGSPQNALGLPAYVRLQLYGPSSAQTAATNAALTALAALVVNTPIGGNAIVPGTPDQYGIANSDFVDAAVNAVRSLGVTRVVAEVSNGVYPPSYAAGADFLMPNDPSSGVPVVAITADSGHSVTNTLSVAWNNI